MLKRRYTRAAHKAKAITAERKLNDTYAAERGQLRGGDGEEMPFAGHTLQIVCAAVLEFQPRPDHQVAQRARHQHVVRPRQCAHPRADVHAEDLALAGMQPGSHLDAERLHGVTNCHGAANRSLRAVEHREETITRGVHLTTAKASELRAHD